MGVRGLSTFVQANEDLFINDHQLRDTHLVVDGFNLLNRLEQVSKDGERTDLFGGDMVAFGLTLKQFFDNLESCNIKPILVMDGAATFEDSKCKAAEKLSRSLKRFGNVLQINDYGIEGEYVLPATANIVFKSVAVDRGIKIYQGFFEADMEVARLAREYKCPALSDDSDFFIVDLPQGLIPISSLKWQTAKKAKATQQDMVKPGTKVGRNEFSYIVCNLYKRENFKNYIPNLDIRCLPLLGPLSGNDFVKADKHLTMIDNLQVRSIRVLKEIKYNNSFSHRKLLKLLYYFAGKTPDQVIDQLSLSIPAYGRSKFREVLKSDMNVYVPPLEDTYETELRKIYDAGYKLTYAKRMPETLNAECDKAIKSLANWLISCAEKSVMTHKVLELLNKNVLFIKPAMDDVSLPSAQMCRYRVYGLIARLLRPTKVLGKPIEIYDRVGRSYDKILAQQVDMMNGIGPIEYLAYDVPSLPRDTRRDLVLATFHFSHDKLVEGLLDCDTWFEPKHGDEFMTVWMLMDYIDVECKDAKLTKHFRQAVMLCLVYYFCILQSDVNFDSHMEQLNNEDFISGLKGSIRGRHLSDKPVMGRNSNLGTRVYESRILHQLLQLHVSIESFNLLNAFLGDPLTRVRAENWLNSCLIYNLTEALHKGMIKVPSMPDIIERAMESYSSD